MDVIFGTKVNLPWMEDINLSQKTNFYERNVVGSYRKFNPASAVESNETENISFDNPEDEDF
jgi:hypothetical protein